MKKILILFAVFAGEASGIYAEMMSASKLHEGFGFAPTFLRAFLFMLAAGILLLVGYMLGLKAFENIYIVSVVSITSILVLEPLLAFLVLHQLPTRGAVIGLVLGGVGLFSALFVK